MNNKKQLYKEKERLLKIKKAQDFLDISDDKVDEYYDIKNKTDISKTISIISGLTSVTESILGIYALSNDYNLKYHLLNIIDNGINPIIDDVTKMEYVFLLTSIIVFRVIHDKSNEISYNYEEEKRLLEKKEPDLKNYKYLKYLKNKN